VQVKAPAEQAYVVLSWKVPGFKAFDNEPSNQDALALTMLSAVLDGYAGARLDRALAQGDDRIADSVGASNGLSGRGPQTFSLEGIPAKGKTTFCRGITFHAYKNRKIVREFTHWNFRDVGVQLGALEPQQKFWLKGWQPPK
jgi:Zn-dependent M16 (insulinase) family peptidase